MGADAEVGEDAVHLFDALDAQEVGCESKILGDELKTVIIRRVDCGIGVAVKPEKPAFGTQPIENATAVTAATNILYSYLYRQCSSSYLPRSVNVLPRGSAPCLERNEK